MFLFIRILTISSYSNENGIALSVSYRRQTSEISLALGKSWLSSFNQTSYTTYHVITAWNINILFLNIRMMCMVGFLVKYISQLLKGLQECLRTSMTCMSLLLVWTIQRIIHYWQVDIRSPRGTLCSAKSIQFLI